MITRVPNIVHPQNVCALFIYYSSTIFEFPDLIYWMVSDFIFHLRDNQAYLRDVNTTNTCLLKLFCLNWHFACNQRWASDELIVPKFALPLYCLFLLSCFLGVLVFGLFGFFRYKTIRSRSENLQSWTKVLTHFSKTNAFYRLPSVISKDIVFVYSQPPSPFSMLQYAPWTLSPGYNIEKGRGGRNVKIRDWKTHVFNETGLFRGVSQLLLSMIVNRWIW